MNEGHYYYRTYSRTRKKWTRRSVGIQTFGKILDTIDLMMYFFFQRPENKYKFEVVKVPCSTEPYEMQSYESYFGPLTTNSVSFQNLPSLVRDLTNTSRSGRVVEFSVGRNTKEMSGLDRIRNDNLWFETSRDISRPLVSIHR